MRSRTFWIAALAGALVLGVVGTAAASSNLYTPKTPYSACANARGILTLANSVTGKCGVNSVPVTISARGPQGQQGARGPQGQQGARGPQGHQGPAGQNAIGLTEPWRTCTPTLCVDTNDTTTATTPYEPVVRHGGWSASVVDEGAQATLSVIVLEDVLTTGQSGPATITLTWDPADFTSVFVAGLTGCETTSPDGGSYGNYLTCPVSVTGGVTLASGYDFTFTATTWRANPSVLVTATVQLDGQQASATYPIAIAK